MNIQKSYPWRKKLLPAVQTTPVLKSRSAPFRNAARHQLNSKEASLVSTCFSPRTGKSARKPRPAIITPFVVSPRLIREDDAAAARPSVIVEHPLEGQPEFGPLVATSSAPPIILPRASVNVPVGPAVDTHAVHAAVVEVALVAVPREQKKHDEASNVKIAHPAGRTAASSFRAQELVANPN